MAAPASNQPPTTVSAGMLPPAPVKTKGAAGSSTTRSRRTKKLPLTAMEYPLIYIEWDDHHSSDEWINDDDLTIRMQPMANRSVGWLVKETETAVLIFSCHSGCEKNPANNPYAHAQTILKNCITKRVVLRT